MSESDFDSDAVLVPAACLAHGVRQLGWTTARAQATRRGLKLPGSSL